MDARTKRIGRKGGVQMTAPPGRELPKKGGSRKPAAGAPPQLVGGGAQALGDGRRAAPIDVDAGTKRAATDEPERPKSKAVRRLESEVEARAKRLAALEKRAADNETRQRLSEFECSICYEEFSTKANPAGKDRVACLPCGHAMFCSDCAANFRRCPNGCDGFRGTVKLYL